MDKRKVYSNSHDTYYSTQSNKSNQSSHSLDKHWSAVSSSDRIREIELVQQLQELNKNEGSTIGFVCGVNDIVCTTIPANIFLVCLGCFAIIGLSFGVRYLSDCPVQPKIPVFLFVGGCFDLLKIMHVLWTNFRTRNYSNLTSENVNDKSQSAVQIVDSALNIFLVIWQILGTYWTLSVWCPYWDPPLHEPNNWCDQGVYIFALTQLCLAALIGLCRIIFIVSLATCYKFTHLFE